VHLLTYERRRGSRRFERREWDRLKKECAQVGIAWHPLRYHKRPPILSTWVDVLCGIVYTTYLVLKYRSGCVVRIVVGACLTTLSTLPSEASDFNGPGLLRCIASLRKIFFTTWLR